MSETGDWEPAPEWKGHDFSAAYAGYDKHVGRSYDDAKASDKTVDDLVPVSLATDSESPMVIAIDVTGSMGEWPKVMFSKLPYLEMEAKEYLGSTMQISWAGVGDVFSDQYPLQVRPFTSGPDLKTRMEELVIEGNGGSNYHESYDLAALYYARNVNMPKAVRPIFIFIGDEGLYEQADKAGAAKWSRVNLSARLPLEQIVNELQQKFSVYVIRKPYGSHYDRRRGTDAPSAQDQTIHKQWVELLGADHVVMLPDASRVVDVIFGILAKETGRVGYFKNELADRQTPTQVNTVMTALTSIHKLPHKTLKKLPGPAGASVTRGRKADADDSVSLL
jgi:hypothetical protein